MLWLCLLVCCIFCVCMYLEQAELILIFDFWLSVFFFSEFFMSVVFNVLFFSFSRVSLFLQVS